MEDPKTITITNFGGPLTRRTDGNIESGLAKFETSWGYDPYSKPGNLTWMEQPTSILTLTGTDGPITTMRQRTEGPTNFVYAIAKNKTLYKIQVNDTGTVNPNFDTPSVVGTLERSTNVLRSAVMVFYGATEKIFYGDDSGIQRIQFDGVPLSSVLTSSSIVTAVPRAMTTFLGKIYFTNGNNIGEIDSTEGVTTGSKLSPALPVGTVARDLEVTPDGNYLQITASKNNPDGGFTLLAPTPSASTDSFKFLWNGIDNGVTSFETYDGLGLTSSATFGDKNYSLGYDPMGAAIFLGSEKVTSLPKLTSPAPTATFSVGNQLCFMSPESDSGTYKGAFYNYGQYDNDIPGGLFRILKHSPVSKTDVEFIPACINVSNLLYYPSFSAYTNEIAGSGKIYFSAMESSGSPASDVEQLWRFSTAPTGVGSIVAGVYETQTQLFSKKVSVKEVRLYTEPLVANNSFVIDLIGSGGSVMSSGSQIFTVGTNVTAGQDMVQWNPAVSPSYAVGVRITNSSVLGTKNWTAMKLELDYIHAGK